MPNLLFGLLVLLLFLVFFEEKINLPTFLQVGGRMHPMILHLPIGMMVALGVSWLLKKYMEEASWKLLFTSLLALTTLCTFFTALAGLFLSLEGGYNPDSLSWHKWSGVGLSVLLYLWYVLHSSTSNSKRISTGMILSSFGVMVLAGHWGGELTHGEDYVLAPIQEEESLEISPETSLYLAAVQPVLEQKCFSCHNTGKSKGQLVMSNPALLMAGGEHGPILKKGDPDSSSMMERIHLPMENEEHMPPEGKRQLSELEISLLHEWIRSGAHFDKPLAEYEPEDPVYQLASQFFELSSPTTKTYAFKAASPALIQKLNTPLRTVTPISAGSPALQATIFIRKTYQPSFLEELLEARDQIVSINLTDLPIGDKDLATLAKFPNLEKLILNGTDISGENLGVLSANENLQSLSLSNTEVSSAALNEIEKLSSLDELYVWSTDLEESELKELEDSNSQLTVYTGYVPDENEILALNPPRLLNKSNLLKVEEAVSYVHKFPGVKLRYTTDGTDPDSLESPEYTEPLLLDRFTIIKVKAFVDGWKSSEVLENNFFLQGTLPSKAKLIYPPHKNYPGKGAATLIDGEKADPDQFRVPGWLGYQDTDFAAYCYFEEEVPEIKQVTLSYGRNIGAYIMPPVKVTVWGGENEQSLKKLGSVSTDKVESFHPNVTGGVPIDIPKGKYPCFKVVAETLKSLPDWHRGAGTPAWVFVDEVLFY
ncbi:MAG: c-type cytochrome domain-containing protein [Bacteroidota bacterium]